MLKLDYSVKVEIIADRIIEKETDLKSAIMKYTGINAVRCLFSLSTSGKLLKYKNVIIFSFDSYADYVKNIDKELAFFLTRDLGNNDEWCVQARILLQEWNTQI